MFEDSLFASNTQAHPRQALTAIVSFAVQTLFVGTAVVLPLLFTHVPPMRTLREIVQVPAAPRIVPSNSAPISSAARQVNFSNPLQVPRNIPTSIDDDVQVAPPPSLAQIGSPGRGDARLSAILNGGITIAPTMVRPSSPRQRISSGVEQGLLIRDVKPIYPALAREAGVQGQVILEAVIGKDGRIENLRALGGNPMLIKAAIDAVQQWRYRPYLLNGEPVEVETQITVNFNLS